MDNTQVKQNLISSLDNFNAVLDKLSGKVEPEVMSAILDKKKKFEEDLKIFFKLDEELFDTTTKLYREVEKQNELKARMKQNVLTQEQEFVGLKRVTSDVLERIQW